MREHCAGRRGAPARARACLQALLDGQQQRDQAEEEGRNNAQWKGYVQAEVAAAAEEAPVVVPACMQSMFPLSLAILVVAAVMVVQTHAACIPVCKVLQGFPAHAVDGHLQAP